MRFLARVALVLVPLAAAGIYIQLLQYEIDGRTEQLRQRETDVARLKEDLELRASRHANELRKSMEEVERLRAELARAAYARSEPVPSPAAMNARPPIPQPGPGKPEEEKRFEVLRTISSVEKTLALSTEEQTQLRERMRSAVMEGRRADAAIREALGEERFLEYRRKRLEFHQNARNEFSEQEAYILSRKLGLNSEQEALVKELIISSQNQFFPLHEENEEDAPEKGRAISTAEWLRRELLRQDHVGIGMRRILSDDQYNRYVELAETSSANRAHRSFVDTSEREENRIESSQTP